MGGIKYLDDHTPEHNPQTASNDRLVRPRGFLREPDRFKYYSQH